MTIEPPILRRLSVLVVDDYAENLEFVAAVLADLDVDVLKASSGAEAIRMAFANPPDLILLDIMMPGLDGFEVCRVLKKNPVLDDVPIIFLTADGDFHREIEGLRTGADDFLTKPIPAMALVARVSTHLRLAQAKIESRKRAGLAGALAASVTLGHELNNPLQAILFNSEILLGAVESLPPELAESARVIHDMAVRCGDVVHRMTHLAELVFVHYAVGMPMVDVDQSRTIDDDGPAGLPALRARPDE